MVGCETALARLVPLNLLVPVPRRPTYCRILSAVTSLAGGAGGRGLVCLGPTLGFRPSMTARAMRALLGTRTGSGRSVHVLATVERPASGSTAQLGRPFFETPQSMTHRLSKLSQQHTPSFHIHTHRYLFKIITLTHTHSSSHTIFHRTPSFTQNFHIQLSNCSIQHHLLCLCFLSLRTISSILTLT